MSLTDDESGSVGETEGSTGADQDVSGPAGRGSEDSLGWRGWVVVGALVVSLLVIPWVIVALPQAGGFLESVGLGFRDAYLVLPFVPAAGLGVLAVWAAVANHRSE